MAYHVHPRVRHLDSSSPEFHSSGGQSVDERSTGPSSNFAESSGLSSVDKVVPMGLSRVTENCSANKRGNDFFGMDTYNLLFSRNVINTERIPDDVPDHSYTLIPSKGIYYLLDNQMLKRCMIAKKLGHAFDIASIFPRSGPIEEIVEELHRRKDHNSPMENFFSNRRRSSSFDNRSDTFGSNRNNQTRKYEDVNSHNYDHILSYSNNKFPNNNNNDASENDDFKSFITEIDNTNIQLHRDSNKLSENVSLYNKNNGIKDLDRNQIYNNNNKYSEFRIEEKDKEKEKGYSMYPNLLTSPLNTPGTSWSTPSNESTFYADITLNTLNEVVNTEIEIKTSMNTSQQSPTSTTDFIELECATRKKTEILNNFKNKIWELSHGVNGAAKHKLIVISLLLDSFSGEKNELFVIEKLIESLDIDCSK